MALTNKQKAFIDEYLVDFNATQAAIRAGYSEKSAYSIGWENLQKDYIAQRIESRLASFGAQKPDEVANRKTNSKSNCVYLIQEDFCGLVKIGIAADPVKRMANLQTACPQKLSLVAVLRTDRASEVEVGLHTQFSEKHVRGEWFRLTEADVDGLRVEWADLR